MSERAEKPGTMPNDPQIAKSRDRSRNRLPACRPHTASARSGGSRFAAVKRRTVCFASTILVLWTILIPVSTPGQPSLVDYKAAFLYHFIDFVEWPEADSSAVFKVGILGESDVADVLRGIAQRKGIGSRPLVVETYSEVQGIAACHLLFITSRYADDLPAIQRLLGKRNVLTVSDTPGLAEAGVAINLILVQDQLKFEINRRSLEHAGLNASAQLLKLAILVEPGDRGDAP